MGEGAIRRAIRRLVRRFDSGLWRVGLMRKSQQVFKRADITFGANGLNDPGAGRTHVYLEFHNGIRIAGYLDPFPPRTKPLLISDHPVFVP